MRAYYLNPNIDAKGLKELDAIADNHAKVCREGIASMMPEPGDCEEVRKAKESMMAYLITSLLTFG